MEQLFEILKYILPSLVVFFTVFYLIKLYLFGEEKKRIIQLKQDSRNLVTPIRLQAYERIAMYLERINPSNLVMRLNNSKLNVAQFQILLNSSIRSEFEHNLSQQIYISSEAWEAVKNAKEEVVKIINLAAGKLNANATSNELASKIFEIIVDYNILPTDSALEVLKKEIRILY